MAKAPLVVFFIIVNDDIQGPIPEKDLHDAIAVYVEDGTPLHGIKIYRANPTPSVVTFKIEV
jgi:hypothetical protein